MSKSTEEIRVNHKSLPNSLALHDEDDALDQARDVVSFLSLASESIVLGIDEEGTPGPAYECWRLGMHYCFSLALDLMDIAKGEKFFPFAAIGDAPSLKDLLTQKNKG